MNAARGPEAGDLSCEAYRAWLRLSRWFGTGRTDRGGSEAGQRVGEPRRGATPSGWHFRAVPGPREATQCSPTQENLFPFAVESSELSPFSLLRQRGTRFCPHDRWVKTLIGAFGADQVPGPTCGLPKCGKPPCLHDSSAPGLT